MSVKSFLLVTCVFVIIISCRVQQFQIAPEIEQNDSIKYEVVFDPGFEVWYTLRNSKVMMRDITYYHNWNLQYVQAWNTSSSRLVGFPINYDK